MNVLYLVAALGLMVISHGLPMPQPQSLVPGVFIPADAFRNLQDRANANDKITTPQPVSNQGYQPNVTPQNFQPNVNQGYQPNSNIQISQPITNPGYRPNTNIPNSQPIANQIYEPNANIQNPLSNQVYTPNMNVQNPQSNINQGYQPNTNVLNTQPIVNPGYQPATNGQTQQPSYPAVYPNQPQYQPVITFRTSPNVNPPSTTNQAQPLIVERMAGLNSNQLNVLPTNQATVLSMNQPNLFPLNQPNSQPGQSIIYVQQPQPNQQTFFVPQSNQPVQQPFAFTNQGLAVQNGQVGQPTKVLFTNPSYGSGGQVQGQNPNSVYTLIPIGGQNSNSNNGPYLIPIQSGASSPIFLGTGK